MTVEVGETAFVATYPEGHELEGQPEVRSIQCANCFRQVDQERVNRPWLERMFPRQRQLFLLLCVIERGTESWHPEYAVWFPANCAICEREGLK